MSFSMADLAIFIILWIMIVHYNKKQPLSGATFNIYLTKDDF